MPPLLYKDRCKNKLPAETFGPGCAAYLTYSILLLHTYIVYAVVYYCSAWPEFLNNNSRSHSLETSRELVKAEEGNEKSILCMMDMPISTWFLKIENFEAKCSNISNFFDRTHKYYTYREDFLLPPCKKSLKKCEIIFKDLTFFLFVQSLSSYQYKNWKCFLLIEKSYQSTQGWKQLI